MKNYGTQLTSDQAIAFHNSKVWESWTLQEIARFQLFQTMLCVPFSKFHQAVQEALGRPVFTHEFANQDALIEEYLGTKPAPSFDEIIALIPSEKRIVIGI